MLYTTQHVIDFWKQALYNYYSYTEKNSHLIDRKSQNHTIKMSSEYCGI